MTVFRANFQLFYEFGLSFSFSFYATNIMVNDFVRYNIFCICYGVHPTKKWHIPKALYTFNMCIPVFLNSMRDKRLAPVVWQKTSTFDLVVNGSSFSTWVVEQEGSPAFHLATDGWPLSIELRYHFFARSILVVFGILHNNFCRKKRSWWVNPQG